MMPQDPRKAIQEQLHNALADCYYQAKCLQWINDEFNALNNDDQNQIMVFLKKTGCQDLIVKE